MNSRLARITLVLLEPPRSSSRVASPPSRVAVPPSEMIATVRSILRGALSEDTSYTIGCNLMQVTIELRTAFSRSVTEAASTACEPLKPQP